MIPLEPLFGVPAKKICEWIIRPLLNGDVHIKNSMTKYSTLLYALVGIESFLVFEVK